MTILDPTAEDVMALDDVQLRRLVARLGAADLRARGLPETGVGDGGDQRAADGGIDVRIDGPAEQAEGMLLRLPLGVQVKATPMRRRDIVREMRPGGCLRPAIRALAEAGGAYVIAAGRDNHAETALATVQAAMREGLGGEADLPTDLYDASRLARWAGQFPGVSAWLLAKAGRPAGGWLSLEAWSIPGGEARPYLAEASARVTRGVGDGEAMNAEAALEAMTTVLARPTAAVRLVGLSGMGKTRLAEALFDSDAGGGLPAAWAVYGDAGAHLDVSAWAMARSLADSGRRAILVIDNCPVELHRNLVPIVRRAGSQVSLLTIDFDVGPDAPDHTAVFRIAPAADALIHALLKQRAPALTRSDRDRIAEFCHGNTRIALVLARAAEGGEGLTGLTDRQILDRLFLNDRRGLDLDLRRAAGVASLIYAFEVEGPPDQSEAAWLARLADLSPLGFLGKVGDLLERGMAQQRGVQRAILPPAIAAWLAQETLARFPTAVIVDHMATRAPERLARSFVRRLGLLDPTPPVVAIAGALLAPGGRFGAPSEDLGQDMTAVRALVPVASEAALATVLRTLERVTPTRAATQSYLPRATLIETLQRLADDARFFDLAVTALASLACAEPEGGHDRIEGRVLQYFQITNAATGASSAQRQAVMDGWLDSDDPGLSSLGMKALAAALTFNPQHAYMREDRGTVVFGHQDMFASAEALTEWIGARLDKLVSLAERPRREAVRALFLGRFDALVRRPVSREAALRAFARLEGEGVWREAWFTVCRALSRTPTAERPASLLALEARLRPTGLTARFETWLYGDWHRYEDPENESDERFDGWEHGRDAARAVGRDAADDAEGPRLIRRAVEDETCLGYAFGEGYAAGQSDRAEGWRTLIALAERCDGLPNWRTLAGYLDHVRTDDPARAEAWLDGLLADLRLRASGFLIVASRPRHGDRDLQRLLEVLQTTDDPVVLDRLWWGRPAEDASDDGVAAIVEALLDRGLAGQARKFIDACLTWPRERVWSASLAAAGRRLLAQGAVESEEDEDERDYRTARLALRSLRGPQDEAVADAVLERLLRRALNTDAWLQGMPETLQVLSALVPARVLDRLLLHPVDEPGRYRLTHFMGAFLRGEEEKENGFTGADPQAVLAWAKVDPAVRAPLLADVLPFWREDAQGRADWLPVMRDLIDAHADEAFLDRLARRVMSGGGVGSLAQAMRSRRVLIERLQDHDRPPVRAWAASILVELDDWIASLEARERSQDERFE